MHTYIHTHAQNIILLFSIHTCPQIVAAPPPQGFTFVRNPAFSEEKFAAAVLVEFKRAAEAVTALDHEVDKSVKLRLYALYKQATVGLWTRDGLLSITHSHMHKRTSKASLEN